MSDHSRPRVLRGLSGLSAGLLLVAGLAACGSGDDQASATDGTAGPDGPPLPSGWTYVAGTAEAPLTPGEPELPATVTDGTGTEVTVDDTDRIIVAGDGVAAILGALGLGDQVYAAPSDAVSPEAQAAPEHFDFNKDTGAEGLLAVDGTLFIGDNLLRHGEVAGQFRDAGTDAVVIDDQQPLADKIRAVASYVGLPEAGAELAASVEDQLAVAADEMADADEMRIVEVTATGAGGQSSVAGTGTPGTEMIETIGGVSVGAESGLRGYSVEFSNEGLLASAPDVIVLTVADLEKWGGAEAMWEDFPSLRDTPAGQADRVVVMPDAQLKYPSPEIGVGAQALADAVTELSG